MTETHFHAGVEDPLDIQALMARWTEASRNATERFLEIYQKTVGQLAEAHVKTARAVDVPAVTTIAETQAAMSRDVADAYVASVRRMLER
jgi:hypothetical protein